MQSLTQVAHYLDALLSPQAFKDVALNGIQVESAQSNIRKVAVAVDAGESLIERAIAEGAQLMIVHHGLFWGSVRPITGSLARKVAALQGGGCSLYASHLPLDAHSEVGNGFELARHLGLSGLRGFCEYQGSLIGAQGRLAEPQTVRAIADQLARLPGAVEPLVLEHGKSNIQSIGIVTGSGAFGVSAAAHEGLDLYVSGEPKHEVYHLSKELKISCIFAGHYATETFGVRAIGRRLQKELGLDVVFLDETSGI